jgi:MoxR-like ATPase
MFMVKVDYPTFDDEREILRRTTERPRHDPAEPRRRGDPEPAGDRAQGPISNHVLDTCCASRARRASRPTRAWPWAKDWLAWGAGPRASQNLVLGAKAYALLKGRFHVSADDVKAVVHPVLRHRLVTSFQAEAEGVSSDKVVERLLAEIHRTRARRCKDDKLPRVVSR